MFNHVLILVDSDRLEGRIAFVKSSLQKPILFSDIEEVYKRVSKEFENEFVVHRIQTHSMNVSSINEMDAFFYDVSMYTDEAVFFNKLSDGAAGSFTLSPIELANYVLSMKSVTHLALQKILYLVYSDLLMQGLKVTKESPLAFDYGPVFSSVFSKYKEGKKQMINERLEFPLLFKISNNPKVNKTLEKSVKKVLKSTESKKEWDLVEATHISGGPWNRVYEKNKNNVITDSLIMEHHHLVLDSIG